MPGKASKLGEKALWSFSAGITRFICRNEDSLINVKAKFEDLDYQIFIFDRDFGPCSEPKPFPNLDCFECLIQVNKFVCGPFPPGRVRHH